MSPTKALRMGRELYLVNRPRFAIDEGGLPLVVHGDGGETGQSQAGRKWGARLMRKGTIENALADYNAALDDAARTFQVQYNSQCIMTVGKSHSP